jgi:hypothetical protein
VTSERQAAPTREDYSQWFVVIVAVFVTCLITANITAVKLVSIFDLILPARTSPQRPFCDASPQRAASYAHSHRGRNPLSVGEQGT